MTRTPIPILALDVPNAASAFALLERVGPAVDFVKVGLQLYIAEGPALVRTLRTRGYRVFLDLKLHDIPNTVGAAVRCAAALDVDLLTVHASGGAAMLRAAREAVEASGATKLDLLAVTVLTSLAEQGLGEAWGRTDTNVAAEVERLARLAHACGMNGVVASVREADRLRRALGRDFRILTPGIRLLGGAAAGDQTRVATPADAAAAGVDYVVLGRAVTAAPDPVAALGAVRAELARAPAMAGVP